VGTAKAVEPAIGLLPERDAIDTRGLDVDADDMAELLRVDTEGWLAEAVGIQEYYERFGDHVPRALWDELDVLRERLEASK